MRAVLDTSVLIAGGTGQLPDELAISTVSLAELHFGVLNARTDAQRARRLQLLASVERSFDALPVDEAVASSYGVLAASVVRAGRQPRPRSLDLLVAATAHAHAARLYTRNGDDLRGIEDLLEVVAM
jgi:predicted nucleic acid-binding protein